MVPQWELDAYWALLLVLLAVSVFTVWFFFPSFKENSTRKSTNESAKKRRLSEATTTQSSRKLSLELSPVTWALTVAPTKGVPPWAVSPNGDRPSTTPLSSQHLGLHRRPILVLRAWRTMAANSMLMLLVVKTLVRRNITTCSTNIRQAALPRFAVSTVPSSEKYLPATPQKS